MRFAKAFYFFPSLLFSVILLFSLSVGSQVPAPKYVASIELHTTEELMKVLLRSEMLFDEGGLERDVPVAIVLHGSEGKAFLRDDYAKHKPLVNLAAKLTALRVIDVQICQMWMGKQGLDARQLQPFVGVVSSGPAQVTRLMKEEGYIYF